jgi:hypothetical protein
MTWTDSAKQRLDTYLIRLRPSFRVAGADPGEVSEDMRRHVMEELAASKIAVVTAEDVERVLSRLGTPEGPPPPPPPPPSAPPAPPLFDRARARLKTRWHVVALFLGVLLPIGTLLFELSSRMCAAVLFDPMPDYGHVLLVAAVPLLNALTWRAVTRRGGSLPPWLAIGNAFALGIAAYYTLLFSTLVPFACIGLLYFGFGLLPLTPLLSLLATCRFRMLLQKRADSPCPGLGWGLGASAAALALIALPIPLTRHWSHLATEGTTSQRTEAMKQLRTFGREDVLLRDCYASRGWGNDAPFGIQFQGKPVAPEQARSLYYRVTGRAFNSLAPPQLSFGLNRRWDYLDEFSWDTEQGGTAVGGCLKGLSLAQSRLDAVADADAAWSYVEWTLEFKNVAKQEREARAQIALPPGGVVSRLTLWVNGEEREAAFAGCGQVRDAYQKVVQVQRRDPVLVTSAGPDRVLMQCFPVPRDGGTIKVRLGITSPLPMPDPTNAVVFWPHFVERNFQVAEPLEHSVWLESPQPMLASSGFRSDGSKAGVHAVRAQLRDPELGAPPSAIRLKRQTDLRDAWVKDPKSADEQVIRQTVKPLSEPMPGRIVLVVDGSEAMTPFISEVADCLARLTGPTEYAVVLAGDEPEIVANGPTRADAASARNLIEALRRIRGKGGQDNLPALLRAFDLASEKPQSAIVWVHGPQPQLLEGNEALQQRFDWRPPNSEGGPILYELQTLPGPDRILEKLNSRLPLHSVPRLGTVGSDLQDLLERWQGRSKRLTATRHRVPAGSLEARVGKESSRHLARLWAYDEIQRLLAARRRDEAIALAGLYQLVTPVSGAVVLETKQQFEQAGLQPVDPQTVPTVPEPGTIALLALAGLALCGRRFLTGLRRLAARR